MRKLLRAEVRRFVRETPFTSNEIARLWRRFSQLDVDESGFLTLEEVSKVSGLRCNPFTPRLVELFSEDGSGQLTFQKFVNMFSVFSDRASPETKVVWAFGVWDFDGDDLIGPKDIKKGLHLLTNANVAVLQDSEDEEEDGYPDDGEIHHDVESNLQRKKSIRSAKKDLSPDQIRLIVERIAEEIDPEGLGLGFSDFESLAGRMPDFLSNFRMTV